jgi:hypothetical protein
LGSTPKASGFEILGVEKCRCEDATFCTCSVVLHVFTLLVPELKNCNKVLLGGDCPGTFAVISSEIPVLLFCCNEKG